MTCFRGKSPTHVDVLVCGGGPAGVLAAVAAARKGCRTLLVESGGRLGGAAVHAMVNQIVLKTDTPLIRDLHRDVLRKHANDSEFLDLVYADLVQTSGAELLLHATAFEVLLTAGTTEDHARPCVTGIRAATAQGPLMITADCVVDATGDGTVAFLAGVPYGMGRPSDGRMQPVTIMFRVSGVDHERSMEANGGRANARFPEGSWNHVAMAARERGELPPNVGMVRTYSANRSTDRYVNATQVNEIDGTDSMELTRAELEARRQVPVVMDFLRAHAPGYENAYVSLMPATVGVRETRRFHTRTMLSREDCLAGRLWPDAIATGCCAPLDIHNPDGPGQAEGASAEHPAGRDARVQPYDIPYGCLVPECVDGLLLAGRCIGGSHDAHASYRFQTICMSTGAAAGFAAAESLIQGCAPRELNVRPVQQALGIKHHRHTGEDATP